jgi:hypothetical protein
MNIKSTPTNQDYISFTARKRQLLREAYNKALQEGKETFEFEGHTLNATYAKYLLEYLEKGGQSVRWTS